MRSLSFLCVVVVTLSITSCTKSISGRVMDNFDNPVEGASVRILGSDFKTVTNSKGEFSLEYSPGKIDIELSKEGYNPEHRHLQIAEKSNYPLGLVEMIRLPNEPGLFFKEDGDYKSIRSFKIRKTANYHDTAFGAYYLSTDSLQEINISTDSLEIYQYRIPYMYLLSPDSEGVLMLEDIMAPVPKIWLNDSPKVISDYLVVRKIPKSSVHLFAYAIGVKKSSLGIGLLDRFRGSVYGFKW